MLLQLFSAKAAHAGLPFMVGGNVIAPYQAGYQDALDCCGSYQSHYAHADQAEYAAGYAFGKGEQQQAWN